MLFKMRKMFHLFDPRAVHRKHEDNNRKELLKEIMWKGEKVFGEV